MTPQEKIERLTSDILERDGQTYVFKRSDNRLDWDKGRNRFSSFLYGKRRIESIINDARGAAHNMLISMGVNSSVRVSLSKKSSFTNSRCVFISTDMFDRKDLDPERQLDIFLGLTIHEGAHILYTDFDEIRKTSSNGNLKFLQNVIEDEYIERNVGQNTPGLANFLSATKSYMWGDYEKKAETFASDDDIVNVLNATLGIVRYPALLNDEAIVKYYDVLMEIKDVFSTYPSSSRECTEAAFKCLEIIKKYFKEKKAEEKRKEKERPQDSGEEDDSTPDSTETDRDESPENNPDGKSGNGGSKGSDGKDEGEDEDENEDEEEEVMVSAGSHDESDEDEPEEENGSGDSEGSGNEEDEKDEAAAEEKEEEMSLTEEEMEEIEKSIDRALSKISSSVNIPNPSCKTERYDNCSAKISEQLRDTLRMDVAEGLVEIGKGNKTAFFTPKPTPDGNYQYKADLQSVRRYIPAIRKALQGQRNENTVTCLGMRSGTLDTNKLAEAMQGCQTVYTRKVSTITDSTAVCVLVDESGSMCGRYIATARKAAILIENALKDVPKTELYIYGHTADEQYNYSTEIAVYKEKNVSCPMLTGTISAKSNNRDGVAIEEVAARVRKQTDADVLMFVISDGMPAALGYSGYEANKHVKDTVRKLQKERFTIMQISIDSSCRSETMFDRYVKINDVSQLPSLLTKEIKKALLLNTRKTKTSF